MAQAHVRSLPEFRVVGRGEKPRGRDRVDLVMLGSIAAISGRLDRERFGYRRTVAGMLAAVFVRDAGDLLGRAIWRLELVPVRDRIVSGRV